MDNSDIALRYRQVEAEASGYYFSLEAAMIDDTIVFREGKGFKKLASILLAVLTLFFLFGSYTVVSDWSEVLAWLALAVLMPVTLLMLWSASLMLVQRIHFRVDPGQHEIVIYRGNYPYQRDGAVERVDLGSVAFFVGRFDPWADSGASYIYTVGEDGRMSPLTDDLGGSARVEENTRVLGFIRNRPAYLLDQQVDTSDFIVESFRRGLEVFDKEKLVKAAVVLYDPSVASGREGGVKNQS